MTEPAVELRSCIYLDQLQPQTMCYLGTWIRGRLPRAGMAAQIIEVAPGLDIEPLTDIALKHDRVEAGILFVERQFGYLEFHSQNPAAVRSATSALLDALDVSAQSAAKPKVLARKVISRVRGRSPSLRARVPLAGPTPLARGCSSRAPPNHPRA